MSIFNIDFLNFFLEAHIPDPIWGGVTALLPDHTIKLSHRCLTSKILLKCPELEVGQRQALFFSANINRL